MTQTLIDISSLHAVESLFRNGVRDPWAAQLAGDLVDLAVYSDQVSYPLPASNNAAELRTGPAIVLQLASRDSNVFTPRLYSTDSQRAVADEHLTTCVEQFAGWCRGNPNSIQQWIALHRESWISNWHTEHVPHHFVFDVGKVRANESARRQASLAGITLEAFLYALDVVLRYPMYGEIAGAGCAYLNHPIRTDSMIHPSLDIAPASKPMGAISFARTIAEMAPQLTQDEYTSLIHELRGAVRELGIHLVKPGQVESGVIRELAAKVGLPARLGAAEKNLTFAAGVVGGLGAFPFIGPVGPILGIGVSIAQAYWDGSLPRSVSRIGWLRWAMRWDIEAQSRMKQ